MDDFQRGVLVGLLIGEGHFGGDGQKAQITLRMHARHEPLLRKLVEWVPGSRLYGPYHHGGRHYFQWMVRGSALKDLVRELASLPQSIAEIDPHANERFAKMLSDYGRTLEQREG